MEYFDKKIINYNDLVNVQNAIDGNIETSTFMNVQNVIRNRYGSFICTIFNLNMSITGVFCLDEYVFTLNQ